MNKWELRREKNKRRQEYQRQESEQRAELRPLRNAVNKAMEELCQIVELALLNGGFDYKRDGAKFEIYKKE